MCLPFVYGVEFRDFFLADELVSLQFTFSYVAVLICAFSSDYKEMSEGTMIALYTYILIFCCLFCERH